jgi:hypothetical protein
MRRAIGFVVVLMFASAGAFADGSVSREQVTALLEHRPEIARPFLEAFELSDGALAVRLGPHFRHLSAARIGPYEIRAKARGTAQFNVRVLVCTEVRFLDDAGRPVEMTEAQQTEEIFRALIVQPEDGRLRCPD